jgi:hypothetical protein
MEVGKRPKSFSIFEYILKLIIKTGGFDLFFFEI